MFDELINFLMMDKEIEAYLSDHQFELVMGAILQFEKQMQPDSSKREDLVFYELYDFDSNYEIVKVGEVSTKKEAIKWKDTSVTGTWCEKLRCGTRNTVEIS